MLTERETKLDIFPFTSSGTFSSYSLDSWSFARSKLLSRRRFAALKMSLTTVSRPAFFATKSFRIVC